MKTKITVAQESPELVKYTHCNDISSAVDLASEITELEKGGFVVTDAIASRVSVPSSYRSAYKMRSPFYAFYPESREIRLIDGQLENRSRGAAIPARFEIEGSVVPAGFRCFRRNEKTIEIRRA